MRMCPTCKKGEFVAGSWNALAELEGRSFSKALPARACGACHESVVDITALEAFELEAALRFLRDGAHSPKVVYFARKALVGRSISSLT